MRQQLKMAAVTAVVVLGAAQSCGSPSGGVVNTPASAPASVGTAPGDASTTPTTAAAAAHVGSALSIKDQSGDSASITLAKVIDPATGADSFTTPDAGKRFVGAQFVIDNTGQATLMGDINLGVSVIGSDNQTYQADLSDISGCTNFNSGNYTLEPAATATGCATFQIPTTVKVAKVQYSLSGGFGGDTAEWLVP